MGLAEAEFWGRFAPIPNEFASLSCLFEKYLKNANRKKMDHKHAGTVVAGHAALWLVLPLGTLRIVLLLGF